jgi:hypothetical protein
MGFKSVGGEEESDRDSGGETEFIRNLLSIMGDGVKRWDSGCHTTAFTERKITQQNISWYSHALLRGTNCGKERLHHGLYTNHISCLISLNSRRARQNSTFLPQTSQMALHLHSLFIRLQQDAAGPPACNSIQPSFKG